MNTPSVIKRRGYFGAVHSATGEPVGNDLLIVEFSDGGELSIPLADLREAAVMTDADLLEAARRAQAEI